MAQFTVQAMIDRAKEHVKSKDWQDLAGSVLELQACAAILIALCETMADVTNCRGAVYDSDTQELVQTIGSKLSKLEPHEFRGAELYCSHRLSDGTTCGATLFEHG